MQTIDRSVCDFEEMDPTDLVEVDLQVENTKRCLDRWMENLPEEAHTLPLHCLAIPDLKRHIIRGTYFSSGIQDDLEKQSENNKPLKLSLQEGILTVNSVPVTYSDITATNGVLHVIDQFL